MSPNKVNDMLYLLNILEYIGKIWKYTVDIDNVEAFYEFNDQLNLNASLTLLANIGENVSKISEDLKIEYKSVNWREIKGFRNKIIHDYVGIDVVLVYEIITKDLKGLKAEIEKIIRNKLNTKIFDMEEIQVCRKSNYYNYVDFNNILVKYGS